MPRTLTPWTLDADVIKQDSDLDDTYIVRNDRIDSFVDEHTSDTKFFLVAPKGVGKTLLIKLKSALHRKHRPSYTFIPRNELCDRMTVARLSLARDEIQAFVTRAIWEEIWTVCLSCAVLKAVDGQLPEPFATLFKDASSVSDHLNVILSERKYVDQLRLDLARIINPRIAQIDKPVSVYLDSVDESMAMHVGDTYSSPGHSSTQSGGLNPDIWIFAQLGLMAAAKSLYFQNKHLKVYAAIRTEAFSRRRGNALQDLEYASIIEYSKDELREIFELNINHVPKQKLAKPDANDPFERLLGLTHIPHPIVKDKDGQPLSEHIFEYVLRHTFWRPRELMLMGFKLTELKKNNGDHLAAIRKTVNDCSVEVFRFFKGEMVPFWEEDVFRNIVGNISSNTLAESELRTIGEFLVIHANIPHPFCWLINRGLLGFTEHSLFDPAKLEQKFLSAPEHIFDDHVNFPMGAEFFLHPCTAIALPRHKANFRTSPVNIIGRGYTYQREFSK